MNKPKKKVYEILFSNSKLTLVWLILAIAVVMFFVNRNFFLPSNLVNIFRSMAVIGILGCGMTVVMVCGEFDMSFGPMVGLSTVLMGIVAGKVEAAGGGLTLGVILGVIVAILVGVAFGLINAYFTIAWKLPSFFVTIATQFVIQGLGGCISGGGLIKSFPKWWGVIGKRSIGPIPINIIIFLVLIIVMYVVMDHMKFGRLLYAIGGNAESARLSGIKVTKYKTYAFVIMQLTAVLAGIIYSSQLMGGSAQYGGSLIFTVMICVVVGGASMSGGGGSIPGTFMGLIFMQMILNAMTLGNVREHPQNVVQGLLLLGALVLSVLQNRILANMRIRQAAEAEQK